MKRPIRAALLLLAAGLFFVAFAQEPGEANGAKPETFAEQHELALKWANFLVLAAGLGYLTKKHAGPFFTARAKRIRQEIMDAQEVRQDAERRVAEVERRLASLENEVAALRADSQKEAEAERLRMSRQTSLEIAKIRAQSEQEIVGAGKAARAQLKQYSAEVAIHLAEQQLRARMNPETQGALVRGFVHNISPPPRAQAS